MVYIYCCKKDTLTISFINFLVDVKCSADIEKKIMCIQGKVDEFYKMWALLVDYL